MVIIAGLFALRMTLVMVSPLELYADEAQYWRWGERLKWGYYSKPPMIAWMIHASSGLFGDSEWAIRLFAPVFHAIASIVLFLLSRRMFGSLAGLFTVVTYLLMPGVTLSSGVISTDGVLFPFWSLALYLFWRLREADLGWFGCVLLGAAIGAGFLSKYAMLYFAIGVALTSIVDAPTRKAVLSARGAVAMGVAMAVFAPHLVWNAANDFQTVGHTVDNANLGGDLFNLDHFPQFLGDQMGVFGPVCFIALIAGILFLRPKGELADLGDASACTRRERTLARLLYYSSHCHHRGSSRVVTGTCQLGSHSLSGRKRVHRRFFDPSQRVATCILGGDWVANCHRRVCNRSCHGTAQLERSGGPG